MEYTENDLKVGTKLRCTKAKPVWWTVGKVYDVSLSEDGMLIIIDDNGDYAYADYMLFCLEGKHNPVAFEIIKEEEQIKYTEEDLYEGMKLRCVDNSVVKWWTIGKEYEIVKSVSKLDVDKMGAYYILDDEGDKHDTEVSILRGLNDKNAIIRFEVVEERKEMQKYAKITKYDGIKNIDKRNGLEIGKTYKIVSYDNAFTDDCRIYLNDEHPRYFISEAQYELVEKEHPVADVKVDVKEAIQAKIDALTTEAERLFTKRDRLEEHAINLNAKARRLEEVVETIKEFE